MNLRIINDCAGTDPGLPTSGTDPGRRYCPYNESFFTNFKLNQIIHFYSVPICFIQTFLIKENLKVNKPRLFLPSWITMKVKISKKLSHVYAKIKIHLMNNTV